MASAILESMKEGLMALRKLRDFGRRASLAILLPSLLTPNTALNAQPSSETRKLAQALGLASGEVAKPGASFDRLPAASRDTLTTSASPIPPNFVAHRDYVAADGPSNLAMGDLNGDRIPDLVVPNFNSTNVSVLLGNSDGSFQALQLFDSGGVGPFDAVVADFNGDGSNDVAVTIPSGGVSILLGDGSGHLGTAAVFPAGTHPTHIVAADFNGDHKLDLAVTNLESNDVSLFFGDGDGTFLPAQSLAAGMGPVGIVVGDFNGDGQADLAVANSGVLSGNNQGTHANTVAILLGRGAGQFRAPAFISVAKTPLVWLSVTSIKTASRTWSSATTATASSLCCLAEAPASSKRRSCSTFPKRSASVSLISAAMATQTWW